MCLFAMYACHLLGRICKQEKNPRYVVKKLIAKLKVLRLVILDLV